MRIMVSELLDMFLHVALAHTASLPSLAYLIAVSATNKFNLH